MKDIILAIDQGTTSSRAVLVNKSGQIVGSSQMEFKQYFPESGWVEHDLNEIWASVKHVCETVLQKAGITADKICSVGITNQRETTAVWDKKTGEPLCHAIVWQDRRTAELCQSLKADKLEGKFQAKTGLLLDPYFSGTKLKWILDNIPGARNLAEKNSLAFGTIDSFLLWRLTGGKSHKTDATNASRTLLYNIHDNCWDDELLNILTIPKHILPEVEDSAGEFGVATKDFLGVEIPITGIAGDQQSALIGQACFKAGMAKSTYGTGCFILLNTGDKAPVSHNRLLTTIAYRLQNKTCYALEGSIFMAGAIVQWLRDKLGIIQHASETEALASSVDNTNGVYLVPAFTGLGAPYWQPNVRAALLGMSRDTTKAHIIRAALEAVCFQTRDLINAMTEDGKTYDMSLPETIRVDGGMVTNNWLIQRLADFLQATVERPIVTETTVMGAAFLSGLGVGLYDDLAVIEKQWQSDCCVTPSINQSDFSELYSGWQDSLKTILPD